MAAMFRRGCACIGVLLVGTTLGACGQTQSSSKAAPQTSTSAAPQRVASRPHQALPAAVRAALSELTSTAFVFAGTRAARVGTTSSVVTIHGAYDPINRDGESTAIAGTGAVAADYGASRVVNGRAWALVEGSWYAVPLGRVAVGQILAASALLEGSRAEAIGQDGVQVAARGRQLARLAAGLPAALAPALTGLERVSIRLTLAGGRPSQLEFRSRGSLGGHSFVSSETIHFLSFGSAVVIHPPASQGVLRIGPPASELPPL